MRALLSILLVPALLLAGCSGDDARDPAGSGTPTGQANATINQTVPPLIHKDSGTVSAGVGIEQVVSFTSGADQIDFAVPPGATLLFAELAWASPVQSLDLCVHAPSDGDTQGAPNCGIVGNGGNPGSPSGLVQVLVSLPEVGAGWNLIPYAHGANAQQDFDIAVTIFFGEPALPDGYTALP